MSNHVLSRAGRLAGLFLAAAVPLAGCNRLAQQPPPPAPPPPGVTVARPVSVPVQAHHEYNGYLEAVEAVEVRARVKGYLNEVRFNEGDAVKAGDPLYLIDPREYASAVARSKADIARAVADAATARANIRLAEATLERTRTAAAATSKAERDQAEATLAAAQAQLDVAVANKGSAEAALRTAELQLSYTDIRSPIDGVISRTRVTRGNLVGQSDATLLTTIVSVDPLYVYFDVPERDLVEYQRALQARPAASAADRVFPVEVGVATEEGYPHAGRLDFRENRVDTGTGTVRLRGRVPNPVMPPGNARVLYPGLFARVRVPRGGPQPRLVIPEDALMTGQEGRFVYVVGPDNLVAKRTVTVGPQVWRPGPPGAAPPPGWTLADPAKAGEPGVSARSIVAVETGLKPDDLVIVNGLQKARPGAPVAPAVRELRPPAEAPAAK